MHTMISWREQAIQEAWTELQQADEQELALKLLMLAELAANSSSPNEIMEVLPEHWRTLIRTAIQLQEGLLERMPFDSVEVKNDILRAFVDYSIDAALTKLR